ncbi:MAG TPA: S8 family serine peptidase [Candidatus Saccharimonadales bacterium]|nr:S8 family serine peptidase [Candidatus Saccharimonadales bacterium]
MKKLFLLFLKILISQSIHSFNFFPENISYCSSEEYELLMQGIKFENPNDARIQNISKDFLWHLKIPTACPPKPKAKAGSGRAAGEMKIPIAGLVSDSNSKILLWDLAPKEGKDIKIAVLDTKINLNHCQNSDNFQNKNKIDQGETILIDRSKYQKNQNLLSELMKKKYFSQKYLIKNHGELTCNIITQLAPQVTIIPICIMGDDGYTDIKSLQNGLQQALDINVDILHLGLKITDNISENKELQTLLQKFSYVVAAAGNDYACVKKVGYPACLPNVLSVGAFEYKDNKYQVCQFSQWQENIGPQFLMPGHRILCPLWIDEIQDYIFIHTSGTSMAAALMTGFLALCLAEFKDDFTKDQMIQVMKKCSKKIHNTSDKKVLFSTVNMRKTITTLKSLQIIKKRSPFSFKKTFVKLFK